jgi:hypothetical protein
MFLCSIYGAIFKFTGVHSGSYFLGSLEFSDCGEFAKHREAEVINSDTIIPTTRG